MNLESLSNELLLDLFEYLSVVHLLRAFRGLNVRFDTLLCTHFQVYGHLNFQSVSKHDFDIVCQQHLPSVIDRIISLRLSDDDDTPQQIDIFISYGFSLRQFIQLQTLSLYHLFSYETTMKIIEELHHLPYFTHLNFIDNHFLCDETDVEKMIDTIWSLPKLTHCHLYIDFHQNERLFPRLNTISSSLEYLSVEKFNFDLSKLDHLFQHTPHLRHLNVRLFDHSFDQQLSCSIPLMITLKLVIQNSLNHLVNLLQNLSNLCHLTVETLDIDLDGQQWEQIIIDHLPKLRIFQLKMHIKLEDNDDKQLKIDKLITSFRSPFWLDEHQWFVRCHCIEECCLNSILLYTLPYAFGYFDPIVKISSISTCPHENDYWSYNRVHSLIYRTPIIRESPLSKIGFPNIRRLCLSLPSNDHFWSVVTTLDQLISLNLALHDDDNDNNNHVRSQLQVVLDRAPHLYSLAFRSWSDLQMCLVDNRSLSVRWLDLQGYDENWSEERWFNDEQCTELSCSSLGIQCEVLLIRVEHRATILNLVNRMTSLRALSIKCRDDTFNGSSDRSSFTEDELVKWLKECLPSVSTIARHSVEFVRMWIR
ncbi:unnamed protein product [Rotaria sp. Silwood2]|nr:unnamed protein product [Rotaria sp. Silwood2]CAF3177677.1 unnamed protein product [Rotaria sp. Silwood2]CAF4515423.1 unnamed protein product [Rotaria sp. Silwood2]CAF4517503.1 unnamed protein product [Rotaria sp. Silwood2]